jgi:hypothetical protein
MDTLTDANGDPDYPAINAYIKANQEWGTGVKEHYSKAQHRKCGYCERLFTDYGDVEHYRPKSAIFTLKQEGTEKDDLNNIKGRKYHEPPEPGTYNSGYWWLAYSWSNYLVACGRCNQNWKNALFPIANGHQDRPVKGSENTEDALLLDPFGSKDPAQHLEFTSVGAIRAHNASPHGEQTIKVCGLWRGSVVASRLEKADKIHRKVNQLLDAFDNNTNPRSILEDIKGLGDERWVHAGMVRITFEQNTGWTWQDLNDWLDANPQ